MAKRTKEEIKIWRDNMKALSAKIKAMPDSEKQGLWKKLGTITPEGHCLSLHNTIMLYYQSGRMLNQVGGFKQWQRNGRQVRKGESCVGSILVPIGAGKEENASDGDDLRFVSIPVFSVDQTDLIDIAVSA